MCSATVSGRAQRAESFYMDASEHRTHRRSPIWLNAVVQADGEPVGRKGVVIDLSLGGAAIELDSWPDKTPGTLGLLKDGERYLMPFSTVGAESIMRGALIHARFEPLDGRCEAFLAHLLTESLKEFQASQRFLAGRANNVAS
jgi:hypothetical protein